MKTLILTALLTLNSFSAAQAAEHSDLEQKVLTALIANSGSITLLNEEGEALPAELQLPNMIAGFLAGGYLTAYENKSIILASASVTCDSAMGGRHECNVNINDGTFNVSKGGSRLEGPDTESSVGFTVRVRTDEQGRLKIQGRKFRASLAG